MSQAAQIASIISSASGHSPRPNCISTLARRRSLGILTSSII
jgi:hypothetical protein